MVHITIVACAELGWPDQSQKRDTGYNPIVAGPQLNLPGWSEDSTLKFNYVVASQFENVSETDR